MANLCTLADLKQYLNIPLAVTTDDQGLGRLIAARSADFMREINRLDFAPAAEYTEVRVGDGAGYMALPHYPINEVTKVQVGEETVEASSDGVEDGFWIDAQLDPERRWEVFLVGDETFTDGEVVQVTYSAGYGDLDVDEEPWNVPDSPGPYQVSPLKRGRYTADRGVKFDSTGQALVRVNGVPATGQYQVTDDGAYTFAAADTGQLVLISYAVLGVPDDVQQAVIEWAAYSSKEKQMPGQTSRHLAMGETVQFQQIAMPLNVARAIDRYRRQFPPREKLDPTGAVVAPAKSSVPGAVRGQDEFGL